MSENEIKPVLWDVREYICLDGSRVNDITPCPDGRFVRVDDYQSAIDRLTTQLKHYQMAATAEAELADSRHKEIQRLTAEIGAQLHRDGRLVDQIKKQHEQASLLKQRLSEMEAERDAAAAEVERLRAALEATDRKPQCMSCHAGSLIDVVHRYDCGCEISYDAARSEGE